MGTPQISLVSYIPHYEEVGEIEEEKKTGQGAEAIQDYHKHPTPLKRETQYIYLTPNNERDISHPIEQNASPGLSLSCEKVRKLDWHDDRLLEGLFRHVEPCYVIPVDIGLLPYNSTWGRGGGGREHTGKTI